jgi:hypothetical protein
VKHSGLCSPGICLIACNIGDFVPTTDGAKVICSIFIYFGVACIGLLLGSYIAGMLDESSRRAARDNRIKSCPNCLRIQNIRDAAERRRKQYKKERLQLRRRDNASPTGNLRTESEHDSKRARQDAFHVITKSERPSVNPPLAAVDWFRKTEHSRREAKFSGLASQSTPQESHAKQRTALHSASSAELLRRQAHSRHSSMDLGNQGFVGIGGEIKAFAQRKLSEDVGLIQAEVDDFSASVIPPSASQTECINDYRASDREFDDDDSSTSSSGSFSTSSESLDLEDKFDGVKNARYVFLTLREALVNSLVIIGTGCLGFYFIEGFSFIDSWYFTTVLLTVSGPFIHFSHQFRQRLSHRNFRLLGG